MPSQIQDVDSFLIYLKNLEPGTLIPKPKSQSHIIKGWGNRREEEALIYCIPNQKHPFKPSEKGITLSEWTKAFKKIIDGEFSRKWFRENMKSCNGEGGCNFTTIGGIFMLAELARYEQGIYKKTT